MAFVVAEKIFLTVMPLLAIVLIGYFYARKKPVDMQAANAANIDVFIPALLFSVLSSEAFNIASYGTLALAAAVIVLGSGLILWPVAILLKLNKKTFLPPMMFNNSGNLGLPLLVLAFGKEALPAAVVLFIVENLLHFTVGTYILKRDTRFWSIAKMPMIVATAAGLLWSYMQWPVYPVLRTFIDMLGQIAVPLMLFTLGVRLLDVNFSYWRLSLLGAILCPLSGVVIALLFLWFIPLSPEYTAYLLLFSVLPPALLNYMVAERYQQQPSQVASIVLIGNMFSLLTIPLALTFILSIVGI